MELLLTTPDAVSVKSACAWHSALIAATLLSWCFVAPLMLIVWGLIIGLPLTLAAGKFLSSQLYGMNPYNPLVTLVAAVVLGLSAMLACLIPALRASLISPLEALRVD